MLRNKELICTDSVETTFKKTRWSLIELGLLHMSSEPFYVNQTSYSLPTQKISKTPLSFAVIIKGLMIDE